MVWRNCEWAQIVADCLGDGDERDVNRLGVRVVSAMLELSERVMSSHGDRSSDRSGEAFVGRSA